MTYECIECSRRLSSGSADLVIDHESDQVYCADCAPDLTPVGLCGRIGRLIRAWLDHDDDQDWELLPRRWVWWIECAAAAMIVFILIGVFAVSVR